MKLSTCIAALSASMLLATGGCTRESDAAAQREPTSQEPLTGPNPTQDSSPAPEAANLEATPPDRHEVGEPSAEKVALEASLKDRLAKTSARLTRLETSVPPAKRPKFDSARAGLLERERTLQEQTRSIAAVAPADWGAFSKSIDRSLAAFEADVAQLDDDLGH